MPPDAQTVFAPQEELNAVRRQAKLLADDIKQALEETLSQLAHISNETSPWNGRVPLFRSQSAKCQKHLNSQRGMENYERDLDDDTGTQVGTLSDSGGDDYSSPDRVLSFKQYSGLDSGKKRNRIRCGIQVHEDKIRSILSRMKQLTHANVGSTNVKTDQRGDHGDSSSMNSSNSI
jgi:hypothetical protein